MKQSGDCLDPAQLLGNPDAVRKYFRDTASHVDLPERNSAGSRGWTEALLRQTLSTLGGYGLFQMSTPQDFGGFGASAVDMTAALEGLGEGCADVGVGFCVCDHFVSIADCLIEFGSADQKTRWLTRLSQGTLIGSQALTEADAGSDVMGMKTTATRTGDGYVLDGAKTLIGLGSYCDLAIVFAVTDLKKGRWGLSAFIVEAEDDGFLRSDPVPAMGLDAAPLSNLNFDACWIPSDRLLGSEGMGWVIIQRALQVERALILASQVGAMARQLDEAAKYAKSRSIADTPIIQHQSVTNRLADMAVRLETSRLVLRNAAAKIDLGENIAQYGAIAKLHISEAFVASSLDAFRLTGGRGYLADHEAQQNLRDSLGSVIYAGTSDIQRQIIASLLD